MGASGSGFGHVRAYNHLRDVFHWLDAKVVTKPEVHVGNNWERFDNEGNLVDETQPEPGRRPDRRAGGADRGDREG